MKVSKTKTLSADSLEIQADLMVKDVIGALRIFVTFFVKEGEQKPLDLLVDKKSEQSTKKDAFSFMMKAQHALLLYRPDSKARQNWPN